LNRGVESDVEAREMRDADPGTPRLARLFFYAAVTLLIASSFLAEILRGDCPVP
jgi:hypothetical protein